MTGNDLDLGRRSGHGAYLEKHLEIAGGDTRADSTDLQGAGELGVVRNELARSLSAFRIGAGQ